MVIEIVKVDPKEGLVTGKDKHKVERIFYFFPDTKFRRLTPQDSTRNWAEITSTYPHSFPLEVDQEVLVVWKVDPKTSRKVVVSFTSY